MNQSSNALQLAQLLVNAQQQQQPVEHLESALWPKDRAEAYATQEHILQLRGATVGGWKVGAKDATGQAQGSPLPANCLFASGQHFAPKRYAPAGLELEIAFRLGREFKPREQPYSEAEVLAAVDGMTATMEVVSSRFAELPHDAPLLQLADLLNHGALVVGEFVPYDKNFNFLQPSLNLSFAGRNITPAVAANPAGDPRRLLSWLVNHHTQQGHSLAAGLVITTGSYTGMYFANQAGELRGQIEGLPALSLHLD
ncbi:2-keto-4-pentenoate hydratase [Pseudomonas sp. 5P_3.1_Bac2]|uniref:2-keto-4-pentenoate hydratase n=1 Tax=Pseudomonas sp. 5P_3.1_Bac2 TaxID=2971617 RepID=UPI0021C85676|nr:fumarylacetoacetate hydrolase family protein [Pseudomonas sp. 5P_3.1_Bac2]MCU1716114.1 fumarylacetoacetate hydrolase family protein [Pseudomonas sp. 5P_3.1_Bac2]